jgi:formyl-CoA transferase
MRPTATWSDTPVEIQRLAPRRSEHAVEILKEAGYSDGEIDALLRDRVTRTAATSVELKKAARG